MDSKQVILSGAVGALSGGLGTITSGLGIGANLVANTLGSAAIGGAQQVATNAIQGECLDQGVGLSAARSAFFGFLGVGAGLAYNAYRNAANANTFLNTSNAVSGPFFPPLSRNWAPGGTVGGNVLSNIISNTNQ